jgi:tetratricopeptide (TPR) repeat protein
MMNYRVLISVCAAFWATCISGPAEELPPDWGLERDAAQTAFLQGDLAEAESKWRSALKSADQARAVEPGVVTCLVGLSRVYDKRGDTHEAERLYELAMRDMEALSGPNGVRFADFMPELAFMYEAHGSPDKAEVLFKRALAIKKAAFGANDSRVADGLDQYAVFLRKRGRLSEASSHESAARNIRMKQSP